MGGSALNGSSRQGSLSWLWRLLAVLGVITLGVVAVRLVPKRQEEIKKHELPPVNVEILAIKATAEMDDCAELPGVVEPKSVVKVSAEVPGRVEKVCVAEGSPCRDGELLVMLNTDLLKADFDRASAQAVFDELRHKRIAGLRAQGASTEESLDQASAALAVSRANVAAAKAMLDRAAIAAPCGGVLNRVFVDPGEYVAPGVPVAEIVDVQTVKAVVQVPERDIGFLRKGSVAAVFTGEKADRHELAGVITYISELADERTRSTRVEIRVANPARELRSGQIIRVRVVLRTLKNIVMAPLAAVVPLEDGRCVYVEENGVAAIRQVTLGFYSGRDVQILTGLSPGDRLIVSGHRLVGPGQRVNVIGDSRP